MSKCDKCQKNFKTKLILAQHLRDAHEKKAFECEVCAKRFSRKQTLEEHASSIHQSLKPFLCDICKSSYARKTQMNAHIRVVHEKIKPNKCNFENCNFAADTVRNLKIHISEVHEGYKPFRCGICQNSFARKSHLDKHFNRKNSCRKFESSRIKLKTSPAVQFYKEWINIYSWVMTDPSGTPETAYCKVCCKSLPAKKLKLDLHQKSIRHVKNQSKNPLDKRAKIDPKEGIEYQDREFKTEAIGENLNLEYEFLAGVDVLEKMDESISKIESSKNEPLVKKCKIEPQEDIEFQDGLAILEIMNESSIKEKVKTENFDVEVKNEYLEVLAVLEEMDESNFSENMQNEPLK